MPKTCAESKCDRTPRAVCDCCGKNLCLQHLNEHNATIVQQLNPLTDQINALGDRLNRVNLTELKGDCRRKLEEWCADSHRKIDQFFKQKCKELDRLTSVNIGESRVKIQQLQTKLSKLIHDQEATRQDIQALTSSIGLLEKEIDRSCQQRFQIAVQPLRIDGQTIQFHPNNHTGQEFDPSSFSTIYKTIQRPNGGFRALAANDRLSIVHLEPNLCFFNTDLEIVRQLKWTYGAIADICWCSALNQFVIISRDKIFLIDENSVNIDTLSLTQTRDWLACTCSENQLFLSTREWGSAIVVVELGPSFNNIIREWKPPTTCSKDEYIDDIDYTDGKLAVITTHSIDKSVRMDLRSAKTMDRLWTLSPGIVNSTKRALYCCSIHGNGWFVTDVTNERILYISKDGKMKQTIAYKTMPICFALLATNILVVSTEQSINFHKI